MTDLERYCIEHESSVSSCCKAEWTLINGLCHCKECGAICKPEASA